MNTGILVIKCQSAVSKASVVSDFLTAYVGAEVEPLTVNGGLIVGFDIRTEEGRDQWEQAVVRYARNFTSSFAEAVEFKRNPQRQVPMPTVITGENVTAVLNRVRASQQEQEGVQRFAEVAKAVTADPKNVAVYVEDDGETTAALYVYQLARDLNRVPTPQEAITGFAASDLAQIAPQPDKGWQKALEHACDHCAKTFKPSIGKQLFEAMLAKLKATVPESDLAIPAKQTKADGSARAGKVRHFIRCTYEDLAIGLMCATIDINNPKGKRPGKYGHISGTQVIEYFKDAKKKKLTTRGCNKDKANLIVSILLKHHFLKCVQHEHSNFKDAQVRKIYRFDLNHPSYVPFEEDVWFLIQDFSPKFKKSWVKG